MNRYTIYCTPEQAKKALELGAPIDNSSNNFDSDCSDNIELLSNGLYAIIPTAEEMIGWLEEQGIQISLNVSCFNEWDCAVYNTLMLSGLVFESNWKKTRKEAILAAIDAALDYLTNNKKAK